MLTDLPRSHAAGPTSGGREAIGRAAIEADGQGSIECPVAAIWEDHMQGRLRAWWESIATDRIRLVSTISNRSSGVGNDDASILARVLSGQQQKVVANDLGIAPSTVSGRYMRALDRLGLTPSAIPLTLILAAQAIMNVDKVPLARAAFFEAKDHVCMVFSVRRPNMTRMTNLTCAEQEVAGGLIEGLTRFDIARLRNTSVHTTARQFHSIYAVQRVTGRFALVRSAVDVDCFGHDECARALGK